MVNIGAYIRLLRPHQWIKNIFVFFPAFFGKGITEPMCLVYTSIAFCAFCAIAGSIYCFNDIVDRDADRIHNDKRRRPVAAGTISVSGAYVCMAACAVTAFLLCLLLPTVMAIKIASLLALYFALNIAYTLRIKRFAIVDIFCISIGFVLRIMVGGIAASVELSHWIVLLTFLLALFLAMAKRRDDVIIYVESGIVTRSSIVKYNLTFMNISLAIIAAVTMMCYIMYTISIPVIELHESDNLYLTSVFVLMGLLRYLQLTLVEGRSGNPTEIVMRDHFIRACILLWLISFCVIIYIPADFLSFNITAI